MHGNELFILSGIMIAGLACQWIAWRVRIPAILFLLTLGIIAGPILDILRPQELLGDLMAPVVSMAVAIILFEGSLTLKFSELRGHGSVVTNMVSIGAAITWISAGLAAYYFLGWDPYLAALFGAIVTVSGPTVIMPLVRAVRPNESVSRILCWEAILIDPLGAILGLLVFDVIIAVQSAQGFSHVVATVLTVIVAGSIIGVIGGYVFGIILRKRLIPDFLRDYATVAAVLAVFASAEYVHGESGLLAVTLMGVWLANMKGVEMEDILSFKESITQMLVASLFLLLSAQLDLNALKSIGLSALFVVLFLQFVAGPIRAFVCSIGSSLRWQEKVFVGWIFPRGIVAAAISAFFALRLQESGYANADKLVPLVFMVIMGTVFIQSLTARPLARWLGVAEPDPNGILIIGSNSLARAFAIALKENGVHVILAHTHWASLRKASMQGVKTFYGSPVSNYAEHRLNLSGIGKLLAISRSPGMNELACIRYTEDFGRDNVFTLSKGFETQHDRHRVSGEQAGRMMYKGTESIDALMKRVDEGEKLKTTRLSTEFSYKDYQQHYPNSMAVFAIDKNGEVRFPVEDESFSPSAGWSITAFVTEREADSLSTLSPLQTEKLIEEINGKDGVIKERVGSHAGHI